MTVQHDIMHNLDSGRSAMMVLLDQNAAIDTINRDELFSTSAVSHFGEISPYIPMYQLKLNNNKTTFIVLQSPLKLPVYGSPIMELPEVTAQSSRSEKPRLLRCQTPNM